MDITKYLKNNTLKIIAKPNSPKNQILKWDNEKKALRIAVKAQPEKGQANKEIIKFLSKLLRKKVNIIKGFKSRKKIIRF